MGKMTVANRIKRMREERGLDVGQLSYLSGVPAKTLYHIETGKIDTSASKLGAIAVALKVSADYLLGTTDDPTPPANVLEESQSQIAALADLAAFNEMVHTIAELLPLGDERIWSYIETFLIYELSRSGRLPNNSSRNSSSQEI
jgi:transcriptional regulator with XRE-family HTH domain